MTMFNLISEPWPLDGMKFETLKEQHAKRNPEDLEIDYGTSEYSISTENLSEIFIIKTCFCYNVNFNMLVLINLHSISVSLTFLNLDRGPN
jgi:hypothetical protein